MLQARSDDVIKALRSEAKKAKTDREAKDYEKKRDEIAEAVEKAAGQAEKTARSGIDLYKAIKSGDPFAISASSLDMATGVVSMLSTLSSFSALGGPVGAAIGAVVNMILSIASMFLKLFQEEADSLLSQIKELLDKMQAENRMVELQAAHDQIKAFTNLARTKANRRSEEQQKNIIPETYTYEFIRNEFRMDMRSLF